MVNALVSPHVKAWTAVAMVVAVPAVIVHRMKSARTEHVLARIHAVEPAVHLVTFARREVAAAPIAMVRTAELMVAAEPAGNAKNSATSV